MANINKEILMTMINYKHKAVTCVICGGNEFKVLSRLDRYNLPLVASVCQGCGLIQASPRLPEEFYKIFYDKYYRRLHNIDKKIGDLNDYFKWQYSRAIDEFGPITKKNKGYVFDVGCSAGGTLQYFSDCGYKVKGIDLDSRYVNHGVKRGLDITVDTLATVKIENPPNIVILSHVLEHIHEPLDMLIKIRAIMNPSGILYVDVPGANNLLKYDMDFNKCIQLAHLYYFTQDTLSKILKRAGFDVIEIDEKCHAVAKPSGGR